MAMDEVALHEVDGVAATKQATIGGLLVVGRDLGIADRGRAAAAGTEGPSSFYGPQGGSLVTSTGFPSIRRPDASITVLPAPCVSHPSSNAPTV